MSVERKYEWNALEQLYTADDLICYLGESAFYHTTYNHYTKLNIVKEIIVNNELWVSQIKGCNDLKEKDYFKKSEVKNIFLLCFSTGVNENLPLWYMYSGINGKGGAICFTKSKMKKLLENSSFSLWLKETDGNKLIEKIVDLTYKDFDISFKDVLYHAPTCNGCDFKYNTMVCHHKFDGEGFKEKEYERLCEEHKGFLKSLIWFYEKETRILIKLKGEVCKKIEKDKAYVIVMKYNGELSKIATIRLAPEFDDTTEIKEYEDLKKHISESAIKFSKYKGQIAMKIQPMERECKNCKEKETCNKCSMKK